MNPKTQKKIDNLERIERFPAEDFFDYLSLEKEDKLLDLGAGAGYITLAIAQYVEKVVALDIDQDVLSYLKHKAIQKKIGNIETTVGDFKALPFLDDMFDKVVASISLHEVTPLSLVLHEIYRVLKENGTFLCIDLEKTDTSTGPRVPSQEMEVEMRKAGFSIKETIRASIQFANQPVYIIVAQKK